MLCKKNVAWKEAAQIFGLSRLTILLFWYACVTFVPMITPAKYIVSKACTTIATNIPCFLLSWGHWDTVHYVEIAHNGYTMLSNTVYFPFFPLLIHSVGFLLGGSVIADYAAGLILANSCFYGVLVLFYLLVSEDFGHTVAKYALIYLAFAPYALFFFIGYTESLFLLLTLAVFYFLRWEKPLGWWLAGLCAFLGTLTRPTGIILIIPFLVLFLQRFGIHAGIMHGAVGKWCEHVRTRWRFLGDKRVAPSHPTSVEAGRVVVDTKIPNSVTNHVLHAMLSMTLIPAGLLAYMLYQQIMFGNPLLFIAEEGLVWHHYSSFPWTGLFNALQEIVTQGPYYVSDTSDVLLTLIPLVALMIGWKRLPLHYSLFSLTMMLFVLCEPRQYEPLLSVPRYFLVVFPIFILFALWSQNRRVAWQLMIPCILLFIMHITQYAIYSWST